jgi:hypothetical protein
MVKMGCLLLANVRPNLRLQHNDWPDEQRYPFVVLPPNQSIPTSSQRVQQRCLAGLCSDPDDVPNSEFFGYNLTGFLDDEGEGKVPQHRSTTSPTLAETASPYGTVEADVVAVEGPMPKHRKVKGVSKARGRAKRKPLRKECSRPEV